MVLLAIDCVLLLTITFGMGFLSIQLLSAVLRVRVQADLLGTFLLGLTFSALYFNCISFFLPVNFYSLLPLFLVSILSCFYFKWHKEVFEKARGFLYFIFKKGNLPFVIPILLLCIIYAIFPPINYDSGDYHYLSILWYEKYKVVPGLANVHGRLAFNPVSFIISAAYSFTDVLGQSVYPLNTVLVSFFSLWLLNKMCRVKNTFASLVYCLVLFLYLRPLLANIPSPSSEPLVIVCIGYAVFTMYQSLTNRNNLNVANTIVPVIILIFSITAKLSAIPSLLIIPVIFFLLPASQRSTRLVATVVFFSAFIIFPWVARNVILSGYPFYPVPAFDIFNFDWKAPLDVLRLDYMSFTGWFPLLKFGEFNADLIIFLIAILSPVYWLFFVFKKQTFPTKQFLFWLAPYAGVWLWLVNSPEYRFGTAFIVPALAIPLLLISSFIKMKKLHNAGFIILFQLYGIYYMQQAFVKCAYSFSIADVWLFPLKDQRYFFNNDLKTFRFKNLANGHKLYLSDKNHDCINADLPCMSWYYGEIEMRSNNLDDGFRNVKNEVNTSFPFLKDIYKDQ